GTLPKWLSINQSRYTPLSGLLPFGAAGLSGGAVPLLRPLPGVLSVGCGFGTGRFSAVAVFALFFLLLFVAVAIYTLLFVEKPRTGCSQNAVTSSPQGVTVKNARSVCTRYKWGTKKRVEIRLQKAISQQQTKQTANKLQIHSQFGFGSSS